MNAPLRIETNPGPQYDFVAHPADIVIYGGSAGGGKSYALQLIPLVYKHVKGFNAVIFRKTYKEITNPGGLWDESTELYPQVGGIPRSSDLEWQIDECKLQFSHFQHDKYKASWQGSQICFIGWDELTHFSEEIFFYMLSRNRSKCGVQPFIRATCNPDPDSWVREFIDWWIGEDGFPIKHRCGKMRYMVRVKGEIKWYNSEKDAAAKAQELGLAEGGAKGYKSVTFIAASLDDNPKMVEADPEYRSNLNALPWFERERLLGGNWDVKPEAGDYFRRSWFDIVDPSEVPSGGMVVRYWDRAATEKSEINPDPDYTAGVRVRMVGALLYVEDVKWFRGRPGVVQQTIRDTAEADNAREAELCELDAEELGLDKPRYREVEVNLEQEPGSSGVADVENLKKILRGFKVHIDKASKAKEVRAYPASAASEAGRVRIVKGRWNEAFIRELQAFPPEKDSGHDDQVDGFTGAFNRLAVLRKTPNARWL